MKPERAENENEEKNNYNSSHNHNKSNKIERHSCFWVPELCRFLSTPLCTQSMPALTLALKIGGKINLMSKTCNKLQRCKARAIFQRRISFVSPLIYFVQIYFNNSYSKMGHNLVGFCNVCVLIYETG